MDLISAIASLFGQQQPQVVAQDRYMRTPIVQEQQQPGAAASYDPTNDRISVGDLNSLGAGNLAHEVTHRIFNKAGLKKIAPELLPNLARTTQNYLANSPLYKSNTPEGMADEGLAYSTTSPVMGDKDFVNVAAQHIQNQSLKNTLMRIFANRQNAQSVE